MNRLSRIPQTLGSSLLIILFLCLALFTSNNSTHLGEIYTSATPVSLSQIQQLIPSYPGAQYIGDYDRLREYDPLQASHTIRYEIRGNFRQVRAFYEDALTKNGWSLGTRDGGFSSYVWQDPKGDSPWNLEVIPTFESLSDVSTVLKLTYTLWPNVANFPIYPGAREVSSNTSAIYDQFANRSMTVSYVIGNVAEKDIRSYYAQILPTVGWQLSSSSGGTSNSNLVFAAHHTGRRVCWVRGMKLSLAVYETPDKGTLVAIYIVDQEESGCW